MKKRILSTLMIITFLAFVLTEFCACNNLFQNSLLEKPEANTSKYYTVSGDILNVQNGCRSAYPENVTNIFYNVYAKETSAVSPAIIPGTVTPGSSSYTISGLTVGKWKIIAEGYSSSAKNSDTLIVVGEIEIDIGTTPDLTNLIIYATGAIGPGKKGTVNLPITIEDVNQIKYAEMTWKDSSGNDFIQGLEYTVNGQTNYFTMNALTSVDAGAYEVKFNFYDKNTIDKKLKYSFTQTVYVYSNLETNTLVGSASYISAGKIVITSAIATWGNKTEFYVSSSGNNDNTGGFFTPFRTIDEAIAVIKSINDGTNEYKIKLLTDFTADSVTDVTGIGNTYVVISSDKTLKLEISSYNGPYKIDANGLTTEARVIYVGENVNLTLKNVTVTGGKPVKSHGAGIYVSSGGKLILDSYAVVDSNSIDTQSTSSDYFGNGIYCAGSLEIKSDVQVKNNVSTNPTVDSVKGGGIYYNPGNSSSYFKMSGGTISDNKASHGGGIVVYGNDNAEINGGTISNNSCFVTGGGVWNTNKNLVIKNCTFKENEARNGGGIFTSSNLTVTDCKFIKNTSKIKNSIGGNGAGIGIWMGAVTVSGTNTVFTENVAEVNGGAIYCSSGDIYGNSSLTLSAGTFSGNTAHGDGSGIYVADYMDATHYKTASFNLSGSVLMGSNQIIYLGYVNSIQKYITIDALTGGDTQKFKLKLGDYTVRTPILKGTEVAACYRKFELDDSNYTLNSSGEVVASSISMNNLLTLAKTEGATFPSTGTFTISNETELEALSQIVEAGKSCSGLTFNLTNSFALTSDWTPIGTGTSDVFSGRFNGNGNEISNVQINNTEREYQGFFGSVINGEINGLTISGSITGKSKSGGIVGYSKGNVKISNCVNKADVTSVNTTSGTGYIGGIVGYAAKENNGDVCSIVNSINTGSITNASDYAGGILGGNTSGTTVRILNCANKGNVTAVKYAAGYAGSLIQNGNDLPHYINNCYNIGTIASTNRGEFVGNIGNGTTTNVSFCFYMDIFTSFGANNSSESTTEVNTEKIGMHTTTYCSLGQKINGSQDLVDVLNSWKSTIPDGDVRNNYSYSTWVYDSDGCPEFSSASIIPASGSTQILSDTSDFTNFANWVSNSADGLSGVTIKLYDDLTINNWATPIGSSTKPFTGTFDGNGKTLTIDNITGSGDVGLFGYVENAVIKNLNVVGTPSGSSTGNVAGIVGHSKGNITIDNCTMDGYIGCSDATNVGGIIGYAETDTATEKVIIKNCLNKNGIVGKDNVGGIIGCMSGHGSILIENCGSLISVQGQSSSYVGGIIGMANCSSTTLTNCFNQASVTPTLSFDGRTSGQFVGDIINTDDAGSMLKCYGKYALGQVYYGGPDGFAGFNNDDNPNYEILQISGTSKSKCFISNVTPQKDLIDALNDWCNEKGSGYTLWKYTDDNGTIGFDN